MRIASIIGHVVLFTIIWHGKYIYGYMVLICEVGRYVGRYEM
jgi:hypothetical protein